MNAADPTARALLERLFDYAGLFPPAGLGMNESVRNYLRYRAGPQAWMLGRLVIPWRRRQEFLDALTGARMADMDGADLADGADPADGPVPVTLLVPLPDGSDARDAFRKEHAEFMTGAAGRVEVGALEARCDGAGALNQLSDTFHLFVELFPEAEIHVEATESCEVDSLLDALVRERRRIGRGAGKLRTGSVGPDEIPPAEKVVRFIRACADRDLPWKATAGLHHPLPATRALTYEPDSPHGPMYGYIGVILAAARSMDDPGATPTQLRTLVTDPNLPDLDEFTETSIRAARTHGCLSIGSCSFVEPVDGAESLGLLSHSNAPSR